MREHYFLSLIMVTWWTQVGQRTACQCVYVQTSAAALHTYTNLRGIRSTRSSHLYMCFSSPWCNERFFHCISYTVRVSNSGLWAHPQCIGCQRVCCWMFSGPVRSVLCVLTNVVFLVYRKKYNLQPQRPCSQIIFQSTFLVSNCFCKQTCPQRV